MKRIGVAFTGAHDSIDTYVDNAKRAEELGYESIWLAEDYFFRDTVTTSTAVATATDSLDIGLFVNPYTRHPALTAMTAASLDEIAGGDVVIAMGAGPRVVMEQFVDYESPLWTVKRSIDLIRELLAEEGVSYHEDPFDYEDITLGECPYMPYMDSFDYPNAEIPVYVAAVGPQMLKMAGDVGDGLLVSIGFTPEMVAASMDRVDDGLDRSGRTREEYDVAGLVFCAASHSERTRRFTALTVGASHDLDQVTASGVDEADARAVREAFADGGLDAAVEHVTDEMAETYVLTPENDTPPDERLDQYVEAGVGAPVLIPIDGGDADAVLDLGAAWAEE